jgi:hypothetical protein
MAGTPARRSCAGIVTSSSRGAHFSQPTQNAHTQFNTCAGTLHQRCIRHTKKKRKKRTKPNRKHQSQTENIKSATGIGCGSQTPIGLRLARADQQVPSTTPQPQRPGAVFAVSAGLPTPTRTHNEPQYGVACSGVSPLVAPPPTIP